MNEFVHDGWPSIVQFITDGQKGLAGNAFSDSPLMSWPERSINALTGTLP